MKQAVGDVFVTVS